MICKYIFYFRLGARRRKIGCFALFLRAGEAGEKREKCFFPGKIYLHPYSMPKTRAG